MKASLGEEGKGQWVTKGPKKVVHSERGLFSLDHKGFTATAVAGRGSKVSDSHCCPDADV